jgi:hypothetical protein
MFRYNLGLKKDSNRKDLDYGKAVAQKIYNQPDSSIAGET